MTILVNQIVACSTLLFLALIGIVSGCGPIENRSVEEPAGSLVQPLGAIPTIVYKPGNDMQGPDIDKAREKCRRRYRDEGSARHTACIKMMLGKYHSDDSYSYTFDGTLIEFGDSDNVTVNERGGIYIDLSHDLRIEAIWGVEGALCITRPRWSAFYYKHKSADKRLPDCTVDRGVGPWIGQPFRHGGLLISFVVNERSVALYTYQNKVTGVIFTSGEVPWDQRSNTDIDIVDLAGFSYAQKIFRKDSYCDDACPLNLEEDNVELQVHEFLCSYQKDSSCSTLTGRIKDYVTTSHHITGRGMPLSNHFYQPVWPLAYYIRRTNTETIKPGMIKLNTYFNENKKMYFTSTERIVRQVLKDTTSVEVATEGYIYPDALISPRLP